MMRIFLAPVPILHIQSMLDDIKAGVKRFAFGSNIQQEPFFDGVANNCKEANIVAYIYVSGTEIKHVRNDVKSMKGITLKARLCGWTEADGYGRYPKGKEERRVITASYGDTDFNFFWEIDNVEIINPKAISDFVGKNNEPYSNKFVPRRPLWAKLKDVGNT